jgi:hypothetical protein
MPAEGQVVSGDDFLIVQTPQRLAVYNKYQQEATDEDRRVMAAFVPMHILEEDALLPDGFTRCMKVEIEGEVFFLLKDKDGRLDRSGPPVFERIFRNATVLHDTVQILTNRSVRFSPIGSSPRSLAKGEKAVRFFRHEAAIYCKNVNFPFAYGFIDTRGPVEGKDWSVVRNINAGRGAITPAVVQGIRAKMEEANRLLAKLFEHFNTEAHEERPVPRWSVAASVEAVTCTLLGARRTEDFQRSTIYLVKEVENIVMGTGLRVSYAPGRIDILRK